MSNAGPMYDFSESFLNQNSHIRSSTIDRKAVGGPVDIPRSRKCSTGSATSLQYVRLNNGHHSMISLGNSNMVPCKLDRSISEPPDTRSAANNLSQMSQINSNKYKTELCRSYDESRQCKYGEKCRYAHGSTELRTPARHPKYKTEPCRTYHSSGFCPYGPRCHFIHNENERKTNQQQHNNGSAGGANNQGTLQKDNQQQHSNGGLSSTSNLSPQHSPPLPQLYPSRMSPTSALFGNSNSSQRPKSVKFTSPPSLGSTADSPPSSVTDSPTMSLNRHSPLFFGDDFPSTSSAYNFSSTPSAISSSTLERLLSNPELPTDTSLHLNTFPSMLATDNTSYTMSDFLLQSLSDPTSLLQSNDSFFGEKSFGSSRLSIYGMDWKIGGLSDYTSRVLQTTDQI